MQNDKFIEGTVMKGKDLKGYTLCKILSEDMKLRGFQYKIGVNEYVKPNILGGDYREGFRFYLIEDICRYLSHGTKLAMVSVPDEEDVGIGYKEFSAYRMVIEKVLQLNEILDKVSGWECLILNGADITADNSYAVRWAVLNGYLEVVEFLHGNGADITANKNAAIRYAAVGGYLEIVKYLHENGADITAKDAYVICLAEANGHTDVVEYLKANMQ